MKKFNHEIEHRGKEILENFDKRIIICGCGAIGSNLAVNLARQGFREFVLIDFDRVEESNLGTQVYTDYHIGRLKVTCLEDIIFNINEDITVNVFNKKLEPKNVKKFLKNADLVVDAFDNTDSRQLLKTFGKNNNIPTIHAGLFEDYAEVYWDKDYKVPQVKEGVDVCDYPLARNTILLLTAVLSEEIIKWTTGDSVSNWSITLKDLNISKA